jgi:hypothetical protein
MKSIVARYTGEKVEEICNFALVLLHLKYAASIWDPGYKDLIRRVNKIQRKAACFVK